MTKVLRSVLSALFLLLTLAPAALAERPAASRLLPDTTVALVTVRNAPDLTAKFMNTGLGRMSQDPQLKPLVGHLYGSLCDFVADLKDQIGLSLPEMVAIPQGEVTLAVVPVKDAGPAVVLVLDAGDQLVNLNKLLARGAAALEQAGAKKTEETVSGVKFIQYQMEGEDRQRMVAYFEKDSTLVVATNAEVLKQLLAIWDGGKGKTLSENPHYAGVMSRCRGAKDEAEQIAFFVDPVNIVRAIGEQNAGARLAIALLPALGIDGLSGLGGTLAFDAGQFDTIIHIHVLLDTPRAGIVKMIALRSGDCTPERWVPADAASYATWHWDVETTYKSAASLYDSFRGEGALGKELERRVLGPTGIDLEKEVLPTLSDRISTYTWIERPVTLMSQTRVTGIKLKDADAAGKALEKVVAKYPDRITRKTYGGKTYYQMQIRAPQPADQAEPRQTPQPSFGILDDYLLVASDGGAYEKAVATSTDGSKLLADEIDYKLVSSKVQRQCGSAKPAMVSFDRPEEGMRFLYELAAAERTRETLHRRAEGNRFFQSLDSALEKNPLPPFSVIQSYLAPGGGMILDDDTGIHYMSFTLKRKAE